jgi:hypothetical protein
MKIRQGCEVSHGHFTAAVKIIVLQIERELELRMQYFPLRGTHVYSENFEIQDFG